MIISVPTPEQYTPCQPYFPGMKPDYVFCEIESLPPAIISTFATVKAFVRLFLIHAYSFITNESDTYRRWWSMSTEQEMKMRAGSCSGLLYLMELSIRFSNTVLSRVSEAMIFGGMVSSPKENSATSLYCVARSISILRMSTTEKSTRLASARQRFS